MRYDQTKGTYKYWRDARPNQNNSNLNPHLPLRTELSRADSFLLAVFLVGLIRSASIASSTPKLAHWLPRNGVRGREGDLNEAARAADATRA